MLGASSVDPSSSWVAPPPPTSLARAQPSKSSGPSSSQALPIGCDPISNSFPHTAVKAEFSHPEAIASTSSGRSTISEEGCGQSTSETVPDQSSFEADSMTSSSVTPGRRMRLTFRLPAKSAQRLKRIANQQPNTLRRIGVSIVRFGADGETLSMNEVCQSQIRSEDPTKRDDSLDRSDSRLLGASGAVTATFHSSSTDGSASLHPMQRLPVNNNSPLLVNLLSSQQQTGGMPGHPTGQAHQSYSPSPYMFPPQTPHPGGNPAPAAIDAQQLAMQQQMQERQRMLIQQQQAHAAVQVAVAQQAVAPAAQSAPITPGYYNQSSAPPVPQQQISQMGYPGQAPPAQNPAMYSGQGAPPVQQQRMPAYPSQIQPAPVQFRPVAEQQQMWHQQSGHATSGVVRGDSQINVLNYQQNVREAEHPVDKLFSAHDDHMGDLGDLDDIEPMNELGSGLLEATPISSLNQTVSREGGSSITSSVSRQSSHLQGPSNSHASEMHSNQIPNGDRNISLEHNSRAQAFHGRGSVAKGNENGAGRLSNGHDQGGIPNGARRGQPLPDEDPAASEAKIAELVKKVVAQEQSIKAAAAEQKVNDQ
uniref:RRM domain-containing protein n=1 Tax=Heterorhabditis bacteriophora TaxID=37862 RepID=A0A1I7XPT9_HETBA